MTNVKLARYLDGSRMSGGVVYIFIKLLPVQATNTGLKTGYEFHLILSLQEG